MEEALEKKLLGSGLSQTDTDKPCSFRDSILRNSIFGIGYLLYKIPWFGWIFIVIVTVLEFVMLLGSKDGMRLGDEIAKTKVVAITTTHRDINREGKCFIIFSDGFQMILP